MQQNFLGLPKINFIIDQKKSTLIRIQLLMPRLDTHENIRKLWFLMFLERTE